MTTLPDDPSLSLQCDCSWLDHQFRITLFTDDGTACVEMVLPRHTFWERLRSAIRYVIGTGERSVCDVVLTEEQVTELRGFLCAHEFDGWQRKAGWR